MKVSGDLRSNMQGIDKNKDAKELDKVLDRAGNANHADKSGSDKVKFSQQAQQFGKIKAMAQSAEDVRMDKVEHLRNLIDQGKYKVDAEQVAEKLVDDNLIFSS